MRLMMGILSANSLLYHIDTSTQDRYTEDRRYLERRPNMKRKILTLLLAVSLVNASVSPAAADDYTIEMQEDPEIQEYSESQDIVFDEPEYAGENSVDETTAADFEEDVTEDIIIEDFSDEAAAVSYEEGVIEDAYDENFASEDEIPGLWIRILVMKNQLKRRQIWRKVYPSMRLISQIQNSDIV